MTTNDTAPRCPSCGGALGKVTFVQNGGVYWMCTDRECSQYLLSTDITKCEIAIPFLPTPPEPPRVPCPACAVGADSRMQQALEEE